MNINPSDNVTEYVSLLLRDALDDSLFLDEVQDRLFEAIAQDIPGSDRERDQFTDSAMAELSRLFDKMKDVLP